MYYLRQVYRVIKCNKVCAWFIKLPIHNPTIWRNQLYLQPSVGIWERNFVRPLKICHKVQLCLLTYWKYSYFLKVTFFQKVRCVFQISKFQKKIFRKTILSLKFEFVVYVLFLAGNLNFKLRIVFRNTYVFLEILRFEKRIKL